MVLSSDCSSSSLSTTAQQPQQQQPQQPPQQQKQQHERDDTTDTEMLQRRKELEACSLAVVQQIQKFVECLRTVPQFQQPAAVVTAAAATASQSIHSSRSSSRPSPSGAPTASSSRAAAAAAAVRLYKDHLRSLQDGMDSVGRQCAQVLLLFGLEDETNPWMSLLLRAPNNHDDDAVVSPENERFVIVRDMLWPLLICLGQCLAVLDSLPQRKQPTTTKTTSRSGNPRHGPPPTPGSLLLSLQQYTDIAASLEWLVCTSLVPFWQSHVLHTAHDRVRHTLPKSLAGRLPRTSLLWGSSKVVVVLGDAQQQLELEQNDHHHKSAMACSHAIYELEQTAAIVSHIVLLDRFRPMLLPRHLADLYAAVFQAEAFRAACKTTKQNNNNNNNNIPPQHPVGYQDMLHALLPPVHDNTSHNNQSPLTMLATVDASSLQAHAFQTLLLQGTRAPPWLRRRVSGLLQDLACRQLSAVVRVFVQRAPSPSRRTGASVRLARALLSSSSSSCSCEEETNGSIELLCGQLVTLLDGTDDNDDSLVARRWTFWAVLDQLSESDLLRHLLPHVAGPLVQQQQHYGDNADHDHKRVSVATAVRRIRALLSGRPSASGSSRNLIPLFLSPLKQNFGGGQCDKKNNGDSNDLSPSCTVQGTCLTALGQLLRLASLSSVAISGVQEDARWILRELVALQEMSPHSSDCKQCGNENHGAELLAMALLYSTAPSCMEMEGYHYNTVTLSNNEIEEVVLDQRELSSNALLHDMELRAQVIVQHVLLPVAAKDNNRGSDDGTFENLTEHKNEPSNCTSVLPSKMFHLLLQCYFSGISSTRAASHALSSHKLMQLPQVYRKDATYFRLAVMIMLPLLCEKCPSESLLLGDDGAVGILTMMKLILDFASAVVVVAQSKSGPEVGESEGQPGASTDSLVAESYSQTIPFESCSALLTQILGLPDAPDTSGAEAHLEDDESFSESLLSTCTLVVSLFGAMLELGSQERSPVEENMLRQFLPDLESLSQCGDISNDEIISRARAELAEMASHAMALVVSRGAQDGDATRQVQSNRTKSEVLVDTIREAEKDLQSEQIPIRARGVIRLRRLAQRYLAEKDARGKARPMIADVSDPSHSDIDVGTVANQVVFVSVGALADSESFVYLAAVQAIVTAADLSPRTVVSLVSRAFCSGVLCVQRDDESSLSDLNISPAQRIKLTEALIFVIRRRGKAAYEFLSTIMNLMLYGTINQDTLPTGKESEIQIGELTHSYFLGGSRSDYETDDEVDDKTRREEMGLRVRTGGPVFESEEPDVVRSACITVVSELVAVSPPSLVAHHCTSLLLLARNVLVLEHSRPVRRSAAQLCGELYEAVLREQEDETDRNGKLLSVEMVAANEEALKATLEDCIGLANADTSYDPAVEARCQEALNARAEADECGVFAAAKLFVSAEQRDQQDPVVNIIKARLSEQKDRGAGVQL